MRVLMLLLVGCGTAPVPEPEGEEACAAPPLDRSEGTSVVGQAWTVCTDPVVDGGCPPIGNITAQDLLRPVMGELPLPGMCQSQEWSGTVDCEVPSEAGRCCYVVTPAIETYTYSCPLRLDTVDWPVCEDGKWVYRAATLTWTDGENLVNAWETGDAGAWNEEHPLPSVDYDLLGDFLEATLTSGVDPLEWVPGESTAWVCGVHDVAPVMTYAIRVNDLDGNYVDCAVMATDPTGLDELFGGTAPAATPVTNPDEINRSDCTVWVP